MSGGDLETRASSPPSKAEIELWLRSTIAELTGLAASEVDVHVRFTRFGVDSASALIVTDMLSEWLALDLDATVLYEYETIEQLSRYLAGLVEPAAHEAP